MEWVNLHISTLLSPESIGSSPAELGTWLRVMVYACTIECGGRIIGAKTWKDKQWIRACQVSVREIKAANRLLRFDGDDLLVNGYPEARERQIKAGRKHALAGAMARWGKQNSACPSHALPVPLADAEGEVEVKGEGEGAKCPPPPIDQKVRNAKALKRLLRELGELASNDEAVLEWGTLMSGQVGQCVTAVEALEGVEWVVETCRREGIKVKYSKDVPVTVIARWVKILKARDKEPEPTPP